MKKTKSNPLSEMVLELIKVTPEMTQKVLDKLPYTITPRPDGKAPRGKPVWCCYCAKWTKFIQNDFRTVTECCGMSNQDFHLKTVNHLWSNSKSRD